MAAEGVNIVQFTYTGAEGEVIPDDVTHVFVDAKTIPAMAFFWHASIVEVICHDEVEQVEEWAFQKCPRLRRVIMPGVKIAVRYAFHDCEALTDVECGKLEIIGEMAFSMCKSLRNIDMSSARILEDHAFCDCNALASAKFSKKLERIDRGAFRRCFALERITIPLKDGMISIDNIFTGCENLKRVDLVEGALLHETIAALHLEEWRNEMNEEINSINKILPNAEAGGYDGNTHQYNAGEKAEVIHTWIRSLIHKFIHYKEEHQSVLNDAATTLQLALPQDTVMNSVLPFLELPSHAFGVEDREDAEDDDSGNEEEAEEEEQYD